MENRLKERVALKIGYLGTNYHGFQIQPRTREPTVEGELFRALRQLKILEDEDRRAAHYSAAGRTDKGVHALAQVVSFDTSNQNLSPRMLNSALPDDIWVSALAKPHSEFNARKDAVSREYRYFLFSQGQVDLEVARMQEAAELLVGWHDFANFCQQPEAEQRRSTVRQVKRLEVKKRSSFVVVTVEANGFLRKMVRKIVSALRLVGSGAKDVQWIRDLLGLLTREQIEPAPAFGLVLKSVSYRGLEFVEDEYAKRRITARLKEGLAFHTALAAVLGEMKGLLENSKECLR